MSVIKLTIWSNNYFSPEQSAEREFFVGAVKNYHLTLFEPQNNGADGISAEALAKADIAFGQPDADAILRCENLRWIQIGSAGYTAYDRDELRESLKNRGTILTNSSAVFDEPCAQHLLAMMTSFARALPSALQAQREHQSWQMHDLRRKVRLLNNQVVLILGFGAIGSRLAELLAPLGMNIFGVKRKIGGNETVKVVSETEINELLPTADHVVNILPANDSTVNFLNAVRLRNLKPGAFVYNIGRGTTLDRSALIENLQNGRIGGAYLDVTEPEPLPPDDPLWNAPNCYITPHIAGGHIGEKQAQVDYFLNNLRRFEARENLINRIV